MNPIEEAATALETFTQGPASEAANALADVFEQAGDRIASSLENAAQSGELSFNNMAESVLNDLARIAVTELITAPLQGVVSSLSSSLSRSVSSKSTPVTVNVNMAQTTGKTSAPSASQTQIAAQIAQVVSRAQNRS